MFGLGPGKKIEDPTLKVALDGESMEHEDPTLHSKPSLWEVKKTISVDSVGKVSAEYAAKGPVYVLEQKLAEAARAKAEKETWAKREAAWAKAKEGAER